MQTFLPEKINMLRSAKEVLSGNRLLRSAAFINGNWIESKKTFPVYSPSTNEVIGKVSDSGAEEAEEAISAASNAFEVWRYAPVRDRSSLMDEFYKKMIASKELLAQIITAESGKTIKETRGEVDYAASFLQWFAEEAKRIDGDTMAGANNQSKRFVFK